MKEVSKNYVDQYKILFYLSWIILYFIFPAWRFYDIYVSFTGELIVPPIQPKIILLTYFFIAAVILNYYFKTLTVGKPLIVYPEDPGNLVKNSSWLITLCCVAAALHIFTYSFIYASSVKYSFWIYNFINYHWHKLFNFPIQYPVWLFLFFIIVIIKQKKLRNLVSGPLHSVYSEYKSNYPVKILFIIFITGVFLLYTRLLPYYSGNDHSFLTGYPPLGTLLYLFIHLLFGTAAPYLGPSLIQLIFYILSSVFLYRTINMFSDKETALLGASIYLFSPIIFSYATCPLLSSGTIFFIIAVSYYFLKFMRDGNDKDIILTAWFISVGSMYKRDIIVMFLICSAYIIVTKIKQKDLRVISSLKVLSLSLITFLPWYFIGTRGADKMILANLSALDGLYAAASMVLSQLSWPIFVLFLISIFFVLVKKRDHLSLFFGCVFIAYYFLYTSVQQQLVNRYSMAFYPTISVFLAQFISSSARKIRWKHSFTLVYSLLVIYLAILCVIPRSSNKLITFKYSDFETQSFPADKAMEWVLNKTGNEGKVMAVFMAGDSMQHYKIVLEAPRDKFVGIGTVRNADIINNIFASGDLSSFRQYLKEVCIQKNVTYIMFPGGNALTMYPNKKYREMEIRKFLEEDKHDDFITAAKFNIDDNYIYIYKVRDSFLEKE